MIKFFDTSKLGKGGFRVLVDDANVTLPTGERVENGTVFRNGFHLHPLAEADLFVPCGGRPFSIDLSNVKQLIDKSGRTRWKIIIEGANLFLTQDARMILEEAGVIEKKDVPSPRANTTK
eukprot:TRINITY_DN58671_c0_g1_i2.p1 TRINITY_DN58671_c0_g1~~TRINITY_DN58671_c0_g1_i2.p1  ORF type:complete len:120 (+),score=19.70 TRINITY_DN58671_c0_g1_i2:108-467(+)